MSMFLWVEKQCAPCLEFGHGMTFSYNTTPLMQSYALWTQVELNIYRRGNQFYFILFCLKALLDIVVVGPLFVFLVSPCWKEWPLRLLFLKVKVDLLVFAKLFASFGKAKCYPYCTYCIAQYYTPASHDIMLGSFSPIFSIQWVGSALAHVPKLTVLNLTCYCAWLKAHS